MVDSYRAIAHNQLTEKGVDLILVGFGIRDGCIGTLIRRPTLAV